MGKWQLHVIQSNKSNIDWIHPKSKYHYFVKTGSGHARCLCNKYEQDTNYFETEIEESAIIENPALACKNCLKKKSTKEYKTNIMKTENLL